MRCVLSALACWGLRERFGPLKENRSRRWERTAGIGLNSLDRLTVCRARRPFADLSGIRIPPNEEGIGIGRFTFRRPAVSVGFVLFNGLFKMVCSLGLFLGVLCGPMVGPV